jgi:beta-galactosidase
MRKYIFCLSIFVVSFFFFQNVSAQLKARKVENFNKGWKFYYVDTTDLKDIYKNANFNDASWRKLNLPHDWSIEGEFKKDNPTSPEGGALPGGIGWYRKSFTLPKDAKDKNVSIEFDGVYQKSEVWINDHYLGLRPNGYISFQYDLTPYLKFGNDKNIISVKVDNSKQPNSRWYSGSGIYRNVRLVTKNKMAIAHWGTFVTTPLIDAHAATVAIKATVQNTGGPNVIGLVTILVDATGKEVARKIQKGINAKTGSTEFAESFVLKNPVLWSLKNPYLYKAISQVLVNGKAVDDYETPFGIRYFHFDADKGFLLNGEPMKILGVCDHHDLGSLGSAVNARALERQLEILKAMGCNAIRTSHNPPAPELLALCDKMGFIVMDEAFDVWRRGKKKFDYHLYFDEWHKRDLEDQVKRDRNHPSVIIWSIGNEIPEQRDTSGFRLARELAAIVHHLDTSRPITTANNNPDTGNQIIRSGAIDLTGYNYHHNDYKNFHQRYPGKIFLGTETTSALETRGYYQMPSDSIRRWPERRVVNGKRLTDPMNADNTVSAYDNVSAPWGSTHEESWKEIKKYDFLSGMFIWTGFDYLGEPTPYTWPSRSSYFGIIDLAGFPKDVYYMYQSEWTNKTVLHVFPHWNWNKGDSVDVWAYYNHADEVELFLNGKSLGIKKKQGEDLHVWWRVMYEPGTIKAISRKGGKTVLVKEIKTAGPAAKIELIADRKTIKANGEDMSFVTVRILDANGNLVPRADNLVQFKINGDAFIASVDNGNPVSHEPFKASYRKAFNGLALAIIQSEEKAGKATLTAISEGLKPATIAIEIKN